MAVQDELATIEARLRPLVPVTVTADLSALPLGERAALTKILDAARLMDSLFLGQVWSGNEALAARLRASADPADAVRIAFLEVMFGPWDRLDGDAPVLVSFPKPPGAGFYPEDLTREELEASIADHPALAEALRSSVTLVRRAGDALTAIPYSVAYKEELERAAALLEAAASLTADASLARYLRSRAAAFRLNDYFQSDMDWMDLDGALEIVIGPYEVYEDHLMGYKSAFEAFVTLVDAEESATLAKVAERMDAMEAALPLAAEYRTYQRGAASPIKVVNQLFCAGDTKAGIQTAAFNLPNDERVRAAKGSKKVMLKNVTRAKFDTCLVPIAQTLLTPEMLARTSFDAFFTEILLHEMSHGLGPGQLRRADGSETTVSTELKELYPTVEECKADVLGVFLVRYLLEQGGVLDPALAPSVLPTYLAGMFRSVRFGIAEAHGGGVAIQFNYLFDCGGFQVTSEGRFFVDEPALTRSLNDLAAELLVLQARGDYAATRAFIERYRTLSPVMQSALERIADVPVDIRPHYPLAGNG